MAAIYKALGLTRNPFAWVDDGDPGPFLDHLKLETPTPGASRLLQLIGEKGAGKSTHLKHWQSITGGPYYYVEPDGPADPPLGPIVYWDEADRVSNSQLRNLFVSGVKTGSTVVAGTHRDISRPAIASGLDVQTIHFGELQIGVLQQWCSARIVDASIDEPAISIPEDVLISVISQVGSSLREAGDLLHIWVARHARAASEKTA